MASSCMVYNAVICVFLCVAVCIRRSSSNQDCTWNDGSTVSSLAHGQRHNVYTATTCHLVKCTDGDITYISSDCRMTTPQDQCYAVGYIYRYTKKCVAGGSRRVEWINIG
ncbi:hypothetical protein PoB_000107200 [Plakobranchus ocellatus]|uniref:Uncharacterized protein n=1 Tax=Plakobranchus ocellatus TaxID=259542 RepID=A0AAV3XVT9_9GAST|nr:hypothetical protein PoB_000107200 [Plakobranchus ocellatus]